MPADELEKARGYAKGRFVLRLESPQGTIQYGLRREILEGEVEEPDEVLAQIDAVTADDVQRVARELFEGKRLYLALVGPYDEPERFEKLLARVSERDFSAGPQSSQATSSTRSTTGPCGLAVSTEELRETLGGPLPDAPTDPVVVVEQLAEAAGAGVVAIPSGRYFGFVIGGSVPAALAADWLASTWDQNAGLYACGPSAAIVEEVVGGWLAELLDFPRDASFALVTGCQMAHATCLAAARNAVLARLGWDVEHVRARWSATDPGIGRRQTPRHDRPVTPAPGSRRRVGRGDPAPTAVVGWTLRSSWPHSARRPDRRSSARRSGEVNSGSLDPIGEIAGVARRNRGMAPRRRRIRSLGCREPELAHLLAGNERADSWYDRRAQVAERPLRLRDRIRRAP